MKKGQVTVFVIIGLILLAAVISLIAFKEEIVKQADKISLTKGIMMSQEARKVQSDTEECTKDLAELGLIVMGMQGGYSIIDSRVQYTDTHTVFQYVPYIGTAYAYYKGQNLAPTKEIMETQLALFITETMLACHTTYKDIDVTYGNPVTTASIQNDKIMLNIDMDVKVKKGETESGFETLTVELPVRLGKVQEVTGEIIDKQIKVSEEEVCISCIARIAAENDMEVSISKVGEDIFYSLTDKKSKVLGYDYNFMIANKF